MELDMTKGSPAGLIAKFIVPIIIGNIFQQCYSMIDTIIVGRYVGLQALAAVGSTGTISFLILGFAQGLTTGFTVMTAQRYGAGDLQGMKRSVASAAILSGIVAVVMTIISALCMDFLLTAMNTPEDMYDMAKQYIMIICLGMCFSIFYNFLASILRAIGNSVLPLVFLIISAVLNVVLDIVFIVSLQQGVAGAAYATIISQGVSAVLCLLYICKAVPTLHLEKRHWEPDGQCMKNQLSVGLPMALQYSITAVGTILVQSALNLLGSTVVGAYSVAGKIESLVTQPFAAMGVTMATYGAQNRGINDLDRISKGVKWANVMSGIYSVIIYGVVLAVLPYAVGLFVTEDIEVVYEYARIYMLVCGTCFIPLGMIFIFRNLLQGCGFGVLPMMGGVVELLCRCVAAVIATRMLSYVGVCFANASAWLVAGIFFWILYLVLMKKMRKDKAAHESRLRTAD